MEIDATLNALNEHTQNKFGFNLKAAHLSGETCTLEISYKDGSILDKQARNDCSIFILKNLPAGYVYNIKFIKNYISEESVREGTEKFLNKNYPAFVFKVLWLKEENGVNIVKLSANFRLKSYAQNKNILGELEKHLNEEFAAPFSAEIDYEEDSQEEIIAPEEVEIEERVVHEIKVKETTILFGEKITGPAGYIRDQKNNVGHDAVLCGTVSFVKIGDVKSKNKEGAEPKEGENTYTRKYLKFNLTDFSGTISCIYFATKSTTQQLEKVADNSTIIARGTIEESGFNAGLTLRIKSLSFCILPDNFKEEKVYKKEPEHYKYCTPEPYVSKTQVDLFSVLSGGEEEVAPYLKNHDVVVFDFETTGLSATDCFIIEIGAVKIRNGKIIESFETFVNPEKHIDDESTLIHGITDQDVAGAPTYPGALADFYKFTRNSTLVAYNIAFDYSFLSSYGEKAGYKFDNEQIDALKLATRNVHGVKNYKLKTVADHLGVLLDNAHRAVYDAIATAEVFIKLAKYIHEDGTV